MLLDQVQDHAHPGARTGEPDLSVFADDRVLNTGLNEIEKCQIGEFDDPVPIDDRETFGQAPKESLKRKRGFFPFQDLARR